MDKRIKLHLGSGETYFEGYVNIDYPQEEQTVIKVKADKYSDIVTLKYGENSVDEIRLHHVFEHFDRPTALALICKWRTWLKPAGLLRIETPDAMACYRLMISPFVSYSDKQQVNRHLFGSHEAGWAVHWDGWYKEKYIHALESLGFENLRFETNKWGMLRNIEVYAYKSNKKFDTKLYSRKVHEILSESTIRTNLKIKKPIGSEKDMLEVWFKKWKKLMGIKKK